MGARKEVFISATSADLGSYRQVAKEAVLTLGAHPIEEKNFPTDYRELQALLARRLDPCDAIIHLVGFYYGGEPNAPPDTPRRSWTQWEYYRATKGGHHKPVYRFLARENCHFDAQPTEDAEKQWLQREHREYLKTPGGPIYYEFSTPEELRVLILSIDELRKLVRPRRARIPFLPMGEKFTGRRRFLETLQQDLTAGTALVVTQPISVYADGGVGKTALAVELGWRLFEARQFDFVLFLNASTPETLDAELASLCASDVLDLPEQTDKEQETRRAAVMRYLSTVENGRLTLLILDNADSNEARKAVRELLPKVVTCAVLITSRFSGNLSGIRRNELPLFDRAESREYLRTHLQPGLLAKARDQAVLDAVAEQVDHLPLALELVVSYMHETSQSAAEWIEEWRKTPGPTIKHYDPDVVNYPVSLARVWEQSIGRLSQSASELMHWLVWMAPRPAGLPIEVFKTSEDWLSLRVVLRELAKASLIGWPPAAEEIFIHRILQAVTRNHLSEREKTASLDGALAKIQAALPPPDWSRKGWQLWERLAPHCRTLLNHLRGHVLEPKATWIMNDLGLWLSYRAEHGEAEPLHQRALAIKEESLGPEHPDVAVSLNNLASLYDNQGQFPKAERLHQRALTIWEKALGPEHPNMAASFNNLALLYYNQGQYGKAEPLYQRALAIKEKVMGPKHPSVATSLDNLVTLYYTQGQYAKAEPICQRGLAIREKAFGQEHPDVADSLNNLARLYKTLGQYAKAEPLYRRALAIDEKSFGPEYPDLATSLNNLAGLLSDTNRLVEAEPLYRRALAITEKSFGPDHRDVATSLNNLAALLSEINRLAEAEPLYRRALAIMEKSFGPEHPNVAKGLNNLAALLSEINRLAEAEPLYRRALAIDENSFGPDHPHVAICLNNLAALLYDANRLAEAEPLYRRALVIDEKSFGPEHPNVAIRLNNLALLLSTTNRLTEAESLYRRALAIKEKSFGPEHPDVATGLNNLAELLRATNRLTEAEPLYRRALAITEKSFGPEHPDVATGLNNLALLLTTTNRLTEAESLYRHALAITEKSFGPEHPDVAIRLNNLAELLRATNRLTEAEPLYRRALAIDEKSFGPEHPNVARGLNNLALLLSTTNRMAEAEPLCRRALAIFEKSFGPNHPHFRTTINNYAGLLAAIGMSEDAIVARALSAIKGEPDEVS
jgi:tetratricopeptide (TPR) repeat protein